MWACDWKTASNTAIDRNGLKMITHPTMCVRAGGGGIDNTHPQYSLELIIYNYKIRWARRCIFNDHSPV